DIAFQRLDFAGFLAAVAVESQGAAAVGGGTEVGGRGLGRPVQNGPQGAALVADAGVVQAAAQAVEAGGVQVGGGGGGADQLPGTITSPEIAKAGGEAGEGGVEVLADLRLQRGGLADEVASVSDEELKSSPSLVQALLDEGEAADGGAEQGEQVGVVGLV